MGVWRAGHAEKIIRENKYDIVGDLAPLYVQVIARAHGLMYGSRWAGTKE